ncbi:MAG: succinate dehydrogenase, cytochrome b556 subunit [Methylococcaceae bacterium]
MEKKNRPLSPHLQVYRLPLTGLMSISHRITGVLLTLGLVVFVYLLYAVANGESSFASLQVFMNFWLVKLFSWLLLYALFFHLCHGVRHLIWDYGLGLEKEQITQHNQIEIASSVFLTFVMVILV